MEHINNQFHVIMCRFNGSIIDMYSIKEVARVLHKRQTLQPYKMYHGRHGRTVAALDCDTKSSSLAPVNDWLSVHTAFNIYHIWQAKRIELKQMCPTIFMLCPT